ncbi:hypothetical protein ABT215_18885 [Streptomyces sp900105755]|uniref:hypothetical protein n=1 Tax=Streptomyces sp. 900105755 TaxID=3154389 RepID=UPI0033322025
MPSLDGVTLGHRLKAILEHIETRDRELADQAGHFQVRIEELTRQLGELDAESENLRITRKTLLTLPLPSPATGPDRPEIPDHPAHQQILTALADAGRPTRAREAGRRAPAISARPSTCRSFRRTPKASAAN